MVELFILLRIFLFVKMDIVIMNVTLEKFSLEWSVTWWAYKPFYKKKINIVVNLFFCFFFLLFFLHPIKFNWIF